MAVANDDAEIEIQAERAGLGRTYGKFPDEVREAIGSALSLIERMPRDLAPFDEPLLIYVAR